MPAACVIAATVVALSFFSRTDGASFGDPLGDERLRRGHQHQRLSGKAPP